MELSGTVASSCSLLRCTAASHVAGARQRCRCATSCTPAQLRATATWATATWATASVPLQCQHGQTAPRGQNCWQAVRWYLKADATVVVTVQQSKDLHELCSSAHSLHPMWTVIKCGGLGRRRAGYFWQSPAHSAAAVWHSSRQHTLHARAPAPGLPQCAARVLIHKVLVLMPPQRAALLTVLPLQLLLALLLQLPTSQLLPACTSVGCSAKPQLPPCTGDVDRGGLTHS